MQIVDNVVIIRLSATHSDPLFWWSLLLVLFGIVVAVLCMILPAAYAIGALFVFAVVMFVFNIQKQKAKRRHSFSSGELRLTPKRFEIDNKALTLSEQAQMHADVQGLSLWIVDRGIEYRFLGFDNPNELQIAQRVLAGQQVQSRNAQIRLQDSQPSSCSH